MQDQKRKTLIILAVIAALLVLALGLYLGINYYKNGKTSFDQFLPGSKETCEYNGEIYKDGESFEAEDGCNTCFCDGETGGVGCTEMYCIPDESNVEAE